MDFDLTADQKLFRATTREFLEKEMPLTRVRELAGSGIGFEADWWKRGSELGWNSMIVDPAAGGDSISGEGLVDACIVAEEMGRLVSPGPLLGTNLVAAALSEAANAADHAEAISALMDGEAVASWAVYEQQAGIKTHSDQHRRPEPELDRDPQRPQRFPLRVTQGMHAEAGPVRHSQRGQLIRPTARRRRPITAGPIRSPSGRPDVTYAEIRRSEELIRSTSPGAWPAAADFGTFTINARMTDAAGALSA